MQWRIRENLTLHKLIKVQRQIRIKNMDVWALLAPIYGDELSYNKRLCFENLRYLLQFEQCERWR